MAPKPHEVKQVAYMRQALEEEDAGLELQFLDEGDARIYRQQLYRLRRRFPEFENLSFLLRDTTVWIIKTSEPLDA